MYSRFQMFVQLQVISNKKYKVASYVGAAKLKYMKSTMQFFKIDSDMSGRSSPLNSQSSIDVFLFPSSKDGESDFFSAEVKRFELAD